MSSVLETIEKGFSLIGCAELATEVPYGVVIIQEQTAQEVIQFFESVADLRRVGFVGFGVGLVQLVQDGVTITIAGIEWVGLYVGFQSLGDVIHGGTSWRRRASLRARLRHPDIGVAGSAYSETGAVHGAPADTRRGIGLRFVFAVA